MNILSPIASMEKKYSLHMDHGRHTYTSMRSARTTRTTTQTLRWGKKEEKKKKSSTKRHGRLRERRIRLECERE